MKKRTRKYIERQKEFQAWKRDWINMHMLSGAQRLLPSIHLKILRLDENGKWVDDNDYWDKIFADMLLEPKKGLPVRPSYLSSEGNIQIYDISKPLFNDGKEENPTV